MPETFRQVALPSQGLSVPVTKTLMGGESCFNVKMPRTFAYLNTSLWNKQQREAPTPTIYLVERDRRGRRLEEVSTGVRVQQMAYNLREIEPGCLASYGTLTRGYNIAYEEDLEAFNLLTPKMETQVMKNGGTVVRTIAVPSPNLNVISTSDDVAGDVDAAAFQTFRENPLRGSRDVVQERQSSELNMLPPIVPMRANRTDLLVRPVLPSLAEYTQNTMHRSQQGSHYGPGTFKFQHPLSSMAGASRASAYPPGYEFPPLARYHYPSPYSGNQPRGTTQTVNTPAVDRTDNSHGGRTIEVINLTTEDD